MAGAVTAVAAAIAYDYFHTKPYNSLRVNAARDVVTMGLLLFIGLIVSEASARRRRARAIAGRQHTGGPPAGKRRRSPCSGGRHRRAVGRSSGFADGHASSRGLPLRGR